MNGHGLPSYKRASLSEKTFNIQPQSRTSATWPRVAFACAAIVVSLYGLLYLDTTVVNEHPAGAYDPYDGYGESGGHTVSHDGGLPRLISSNDEPDSKTIDPATGQLPLRKAIILSSYKDQDITWVDDLKTVSKGWEIYRYVSDAPDTDDLSVKNPNGREALPYLTYITDYYANLPDIMVFNHGHSQSWHQPEPMADKIMALNTSAVLKEDYINFRCQQSHGCTEDSMFHIAEDEPDDHRKGKYIKKIWDELMLPEFGPYPDIMGRPCCAQFAVNRQAVQRHSLRFWQSLRTPLEERHEGMEGWRGREDYEVGLKFEMFWHVLFGKDPIHCPSRETCEKVYFQDAIHCNSDGEDLLGHDHWDEVKDDFLCVNNLRDD